MYVRKKNIRVENGTDFLVESIDYRKFSCEISYKQKVLNNQRKIRVDNFNTTYSYGL